MPLHQVKIDPSYPSDSHDISAEAQRAPLLWPLENLVATRNRKQLLQLIMALERENTGLRGQLRIDPMTGLLNRRALLEELERQWERWVRYGQVASLLLIDLNDFKSINDTYGHSIGDRALISIANHLREHVRGCDWVARLGGDEFAVLLPNSDMQQAQQVAEKLCANGLIFSIDEATSEAPLKLTLSYAVGASTIGSDTASTQKWVDSADRQMYRHKRSAH